jgi:hypothetical protein
VNTIVLSDRKQDASGERLAAPPHYGRARLLAYLAPIALMPLLILIVAVLVVPTDWFLDRSDNLFLDTLGYGAALRNADCDIAVYGDSTAILGIDPMLVRKLTGLSACNIAEVAGVNVVNGTMPLDQFLAHNRRPQFIVFLFAPENFNRESERHNPDVSTFEGVTYRFRQPDKLAGFLSMMRHPEDVFSWAEHGVRQSIFDLKAKPFPPDTKYYRFRTLGQEPFRNPPLTSCNYGHHNPLPDRAWINELRTKYGQMGTTVLVDATLLPVCDPDLSFFQQALAGVIDNRYDPLPANYYYAGGRHVYPVGAVAISTMVANQVLDRLHAANRAGTS